VSNPHRPGLFDELKRRRVVRAVLVYGVVAWVVVQVANVFFPALRLPEWTVTLVAALAVLGFPITVALAWIFERTPEGLRRSGAVSEGGHVPARGFRVDGRFVSAVGLGVVIGLVVVGAGSLLRSGGDAGLDPVHPVPTSIAVLPFQDMSSGQDQAWFGQGVAEEILNALGRVDGLAVAARTSSFRYAAPGLDIPAIGDSLGVATVLEGSVRRVGGRVRISAQLVRTDGGLHLWSDSYDRELTADNILDVQEEIAREIARRLTGTLQAGRADPADGRGEGRLTRRHTADLAAYELFLKGRYLWNQRTRETVGEAILKFREAVELDPTYAEAWAAMAEAYAVPAAPYPAREALPRAKAAALRALDIDSTSAPAYTALGYALMHHDHDWAGAEAAFRSAITADPGYPTAHQWYAEFLATTGDTDGAVEAVRKAEALDPLSMIIGWNVARTLYFDRQYKAALNQLLDVRRLHGTARGPFLFYYILATGHRAGEIAADDPIVEQVFPVLIEEFQALGAPEEVIARFRQQQLRGVLPSLENEADGLFRSLPAGDVGAPGLHLWHGVVDELFDALEATTARRDLSARLTDFAADPAVDPIRDHPRYRAWLESVGLSGYRASAATPAGPGTPR
jgi:adenylate cyclase